MELSIIIPVYNAQEYIQTCLDSILQEIDARCGMEVLLLDDGSSDESLSICKKYENSFVRVFHHENAGVSYTRNEGVKRASGKYIMFVDADDQLVAGWAKIVSEAMLQNVDIIYFTQKASCAKSKNDVVDDIFGGTVGIRASTPWSKLYKKTLLKTHEISFDSNLINGEDALFNLQAIIATDSYCFDEHTIYMYRISEQSATRKYNAMFYKSNLKFLKEAELNLQKANFVSEERKEHYIRHSFLYSVYLFVFLVSTIPSKQKQIEEIQLLQSKEMKDYFARFCDYQEEKASCKLICFLVKKNNFRAALNIMKLMNFARKQKKRGIVWETI